MTHDAWVARLYLRNQSVEHVVVNLFYSERHLVLFAIGVLAHGAVIMGSGQGYCSLNLWFTLANWSDVRSITQPQLLLKLRWAVQL
jgi:hypothetical protein